MSRQCIRVAVTGAAGQMGYAFLFRLASGAVFGPDVEIELNLIEVSAAMSALSGVRMELDDCAFPLLKKLVITDDLVVGFSEVNWAILIGAAPRGPGMERADLLQVNGGIFAEQGQVIAEHAASDVRVFVVGNPCNTNALIAMDHAPSVPRDRFYAMTMLDENRARAQLALKAQVPVASVQDVAIYGNHSATQFPDYFYATIAGKPAQQVISDDLWLEQTFIQTVQQRGAAIIKARGASSAASAANAIIDGIRALTGQFSSDRVFSMAVCSKGEYGADAGLIVSYPCQCIDGKVKVVLGRTHNEWAQKLIQASFDELKQEQQSVASLGLLA